MKASKRKQNNRKPALEEVVKARREGLWTRSATWGGKKYVRSQGKRIQPERE